MLNDKQRKEAEQRVKKFKDIFSVHIQPIARISWSTDDFVQNMSSLALWHNILPSSHEYFWELYAWLESPFPALNDPLYISSQSLEFLDWQTIQRCGFARKMSSLALWQNNYLLIFVQCIDTVEQHCTATRGIVDMRTAQVVEDLKVISIGRKYANMQKATNFTDIKR